MKIKITHDNDRLKFQFTASIRTVYPRWMGILGFPMYKQKEQNLWISNLSQIKSILEALKNHHDLHLPIKHSQKTSLHISNRNRMTYLIFEYPDYIADIKLNEYDNREMVDIVAAVIDSLTNDVANKKTDE